MISEAKIIECPRDAMQGWHAFIPANKKIAYLNQLLRVGFHTLDCVSFVSPKAIPQMADSAQVLEGLDLTRTDTKLLAIVANARGAVDATRFEQISYLGYPFSISETFQQLNTNSSIAESWGRVQAIQDICLKAGKTLVVYISMGFGNPYGDPYDEGVIGGWYQKLSEIGVQLISLADTVGVATAEMVHRITKAAIRSFPGTVTGVHLHSTPGGFAEKLNAAIEAGCTRFDGAMKGIGGCPMANSPLVGNMDTQNMAAHFGSLGIKISLNQTELQTAAQMAGEIFV